MKITTQWVKHHTVDEPMRYLSWGNDGHTANNVRSVRHLLLPTFILAT